MHKTCWYTTIHPLRVGALVGPAARADLRPMVRFGFYLGAAFQIQDDLLNLVGDEREYGKEIDGDLYEGKRTLPLIHLVAQRASGPIGDGVDRYLRLERPQRTAAMVAEIRRLLRPLREHRLRGRVRQGIAGAALDTFEVAFAPRLPGPDRDFVGALVPYMLDRRNRAPAPAGCGPVSAD